MANANPRERGVSVVRVVPRFEPFRECGFACRLASDIEEWPPDEPVEFHHSAKAAGATSSRKSEQNGFRLIVSSVPRQNHCGAVPLGGLAKREIASISSGRFGTALGADRHTCDIDGVQAQRRRRRRHRRRDLSTSRLEVVIHDYCPDAKTPFRCDKPSRGGEGDGVGSTAQGDENERTVWRWVSIQET
jgi:hypothetical protein